ncbi:hypothetical protein JCM12294_36600 [Desulfocicer niacini]
MCYGQGGHQHTVYAPFKLEAPCEVEQRLVALSGRHAFTESGTGFVFKIYCNDAPLGVIEVDDLAFPQYMENYLNLALFLIKHPDTALILLDVVMEEDLAGLNLVRYIRNDLKNHTIRIVLRIGQPGVAPERDVINQYEIDDYKSKTELTSEKLITVITVGLRTYEAMLTKDHYQEKLEQEVTRRTAALQQALDEIKMLHDIIPICSHCKKIRDDAGCWNQFEAYIQKHSEARFSHGICPDCARQFYPDFDLPDDS